MLEMYFSLPSSILLQSLMEFMVIPQGAPIKNGRVLSYLVLHCYVVDPYNCQILDNLYSV